MKKIGICTLFTGFNYGSALQAFATKELLRQLGYEGEIIKLSGSVVAGRDIRIKKMFLLGANLLLHLCDAKATIRSYIRGENKQISE